MTGCTGYEVDFISVSKEQAKQDADAICFRWKRNNGSFGIGVYDAGFQAHGEEMVKLINKYYFNDPQGIKSRSEKIIDCVFVSHPHDDHTGGISEIIRNFSVGVIYMNRPWLYTAELLMYRKDGRITQRSLEEELIKDFQNIREIEKLANQYCIPIEEAFSGTTHEELIILSPNKKFYIDKLLRSDKTKRIQASGYYSLSDTDKGYVGETWDDETLGDEHAVFDAENETSIILYGFRDSGGALFTGDAGIEALTFAHNVAIYYGISIEDVQFVEIPHHGGRHNITTSVMNVLFGFPVDEGTHSLKVAYVSVADGSDHPRRVVVNAFLRRGFNVYKTKNYNRWHHEGDMPERAEYTVSTDKLAFNRIVEEW